MGLGQSHTHDEDSEIISVQEILEILDGDVAAHTLPNREPKRSSSSVAQSRSPLTPEQKRRIETNLEAIIDGLTLSDHFVVSLRKSPAFDQMFFALKDVQGSSLEIKAKVVRYIIENFNQNQLKAFCKVLTHCHQDYVVQLITLPQKAAKCGVQLEGASNDEPDSENVGVLEIIDVSVKKMSKKDISKYLLDSGTYKMSSNPRGRAVILNNELFVNMKDRDGSIYDATNAESMFTKLGFQVEHWNNMDTKEIKQAIQTERNQVAHKAADAFVMIILSHGHKGIIYGKDCHKVDIMEDIVDKFDGTNCPALIGKPKVFIIQACQGSLKTKGTKPFVRDSIQLDNKEMVTDSLPEADHYEMPALTHEKSDILVAYSTVPGYVSWRSRELGSWFIRDLVTTLMDCVHKDHLLDILTKVTHKLSQRKVKSQGLLQIPQTQSTLRKKLYFCPGYYV